ncbi:hypothetical protein KR50_24790 [Jeotgalibacillus campisalis]|uniref:Uncharacterized protein n=1 Tax=Jeotgalibacillus campisalis TaxID=220754 RepID=A0A0C2VRT7_9BACL|nr:hypothetical protein KR50_24790 [Jeotgalibacillus campisalis]
MHKVLPLLFALATFFSHLVFSLLYHADKRPKEKRFIFP